MSTVYRGRRFASRALETTKDLCGGLRISTAQARCPNGGGFRPGATMSWLQGTLLGTVPAVGHALPGRGDEPREARLVLMSGERAVKLKRAPCVCERAGDGPAYEISTSRDAIQGLSKLSP
jgi:hypothetical protein